jgi:hypothetical protein
MAELLGCKQGHRWDPTRRTSHSAKPNVCPVCGHPPVAEDVPFVLPVDENRTATIAPPSPEMRWASVELGPKLPMAVFTSTEVWNHERIGALALYCSDGRWGEAFDDFCHRRLLLPRYDRWAVPGGPAWLARSEQRPEQVKAVREQLDFLVRVHELERIVLITHYGCAYYGELLHQDPDGCLTPQMQDTSRARGTLREWFPKVEVEAYLAMRRYNCLSFHRLDA